MAADEQQERRGFTVSDRRRFATEPAETQPDAEQVRPAADQGPDQQRGTGAGEGAAQRPGPSAASPGDEFNTEQAARHAQLPEITLATFVMSMSTQALMLLGEIPSPAGQTTDRDMVGAKQVIDILGMLRERTKGNLDRNEETLFDNVLYDLRMRYVELAKSGSRQ